jgi:hypothetical protein
LVPLIEMTDTLTATKHKEELFIVEDKFSKEDGIETQRKSLEKASSIIIRSPAPIIDYTSLLKDQIDYKNESNFRN